MDEVVGGAGEVNLSRLGESSLVRCVGPGEPDVEAERSLGVAGRESSVEGMSESWEKDAWESILPSCRWPKPRATRQKCSRVASA